jgi:hypothetical protein
MPANETVEPKVAVVGLTDEAPAQSSRRRRQQADALGKQFAAGVNLEANQQVRRRQEDRRDQLVGKRVKLLGASAGNTGGMIKGATDARRAVHIARERQRGPCRVAPGGTTCRSPQ